MKIALILGVSLSVLAGVAAAQSPMQERGGAVVHEEGASVLLDRSQGRVEIQCAKVDTTRACVQAILPLLETLSSEPTPGVVYATTSIKCGSTIYEVSTGTKDGNCSVAGPEGGTPTSTGCNDGGNKASASCHGGCGASSGSGSCTIKSGN
jgi:hypothetical protein